MDHCSLVLNYDVKQVGRWRWGFKLWLLGFWVGSSGFYGDFLFLQVCFLIESTALESAVEVFRMISLGSFAFLRQAARIYVDVANRDGCRIRAEEHGVPRIHPYGASWCRGWWSLADAWQPWSCHRVRHLLIDCISAGGLSTYISRISLLSSTMRIDAFDGDPLAGVPQRLLRGFYYIFVWGGCWYDLDVLFLIVSEDIW